MKILISPLYATSVLNQAWLIRRLIESKGYDCEFKSTISVFDIKNENNVGFLWFTLATIQFIGDAIFPYLYCDKPKAVYVTVEGIPTKANVLCSNLDKLQLVANSKFTKESLERVGLNVVDVVHHAINWNLCDKISLNPKGLGNKFTDKCKLIYVGRNDPRKALDRLSKAIDILNEKGVKDWVLFLHTEASAKDMFDKPNCVLLPNFGGFSYEDTLHLIASCDYLVFPTMCEGFGLPLLEANALGKPAIHCWFPPLSEFSSKDFNFVFDYIEEAWAKCGATQYWIFHQYAPEQLAEMIMYAIDVYHNSKEEYQEYCFKAKKHAKNWDYKKIYKKLLKMIGVR